ncbi:hypothetical protein F4604DRAFT_1675922 [Suillus subluteus]|nr:hypothetical protein F4604DRAFT_1675922 [Suillus subluteus]
MSFQCPLCSKGGFKDHVTVARHMGQPRSGCSTWLQNLICLDDGPNNHIESGSFGDWDEMFQVSSNEDQVYEGATPTRDSEVIVDSYPNCAQSYGRGHTFLDLFNSDKNSKHCVTNPYYPFSSQKDWQVGSWLLRSGLSMGKIDSFLSLEMIKTLPLLFHSAKELHGRAEMLPSGPCWMSQIIPTTHPTKSPVVLYWRDPLDCISGLLNHPAFHNQLDFTPRRVYTTAQWLCRVYLEWMTGDDAWNMQSALPRGATLLGTILSSDKTNILNMMGDRVAHPLLSSLNAFVLTTLLPIPKFIYKKKCMRGILEDHLIHECLDIVLHPLKLAAREGIMLLDPVGHSRYCFTLLASYIVDTPEAMMLAAVGGKTSPVTMAMYKQFGDPFHHEPCTRATTLSQLSVARNKAAPNDIEAFFHEAQKFCLNGPLSDPSHFLTPEFLHLIHREFYDHDAKWLICAVRDTEIDFRFSVLQAITGFCHFHGGISKLKHVTGRTQCNIQHSIIAVSTDAVPRAVLTAVRALMDFRYLIQSPVIDDTLLTCISMALEEFHANKDAIIEGGFHRGQHGGVIENWYIPKLELMQSIVPSIRNTGVPLQWTADTTEHAHIMEIKDPARSSNNNNYDPQIWHHLDRTNKCHRFDLAMSLLDNMADSEQQGSDDDGNVDNDVDFDADDDHDIPADLLTIIKYPASGHSRPITNYFKITKVLQHREVGTVPVPLRSFVVERTAFHLTYDPSIRNISVDNASIKFDLSDLRPAIADFLHCEATHGRDHIHTIWRARRAGPTASLPFDKLQVWFKLWLQDTDFHDVSIIRPVQSLNCAPPSDPWTSGRYDTVIIHNEARYLWPTDGLRGHTIGQIRLIMRPIGPSGMNWSWKDRFLVYVHRFDVVPQSSGTNNCEPSTQLHLLKRAKRSNGTQVGDIIPLTQLRAPVNLVPRFGASADNRFTSYNSMEHASQFWVNKTVDNGIKLSSLLSIPDVTNVHTMNKITSDELNRLVTHEGLPEASQPLGHLLSEIFQSFTVPLPDVCNLKIPFSKILYRNQCINEKFSETSPDTLVPLYDTEAKIWNWALPVDPPENGSSSPSQVESEGNDTQAQGATYEEIVAAFLNALTGCLAVSQPKLVAMRFATSSWSAANAQKALPGSDIKCKTDLILSDNISAKWGNIRVSAELMHSRYKPAMRLGKAADTHAYLVMSEQPWRCFALILSFTDEYRHLRVLMYDHSGGAVSPRFDIYKQPDIFSHIIAAINFGSLEADILHHKFAAQGLVGHGTVCYLVTLDNEDYIIKDHWVLGSDDQVVLNKIKMLELMDGVPGVPKLVDHWVVERSDGKSDITRKYQQKERRSTRGTSRTHVRLVLKPCGHPLHMFRTLKEFVRALRDIIKIQQAAVEERQILHWDCSLNNAMILDDLGGSEGFLIDWEFAVHIAADHKYPIGGTGTVPFMSRRLLNQVIALQEEANLESQKKKENRGCKSVKNPKSSSDSLALPISYVVQGHADDLESLFFVFAWVCIKFSGPHGMVCQERLPNSLLHRWTSLDLASCAAFKISFFVDPTNEKRLIDEFHLYFKDLIPLATEWRRALVDNMIHPVSFNTILDILNSHLNKLPDEEEFVSTVNMLRNDAAVLTDCVKSKQIASESFSVVATAPKRQKSHHGDAKSDSAPGGDT